MGQPGLNQTNLKPTVIASLGIVLLLGAATVTLNPFQSFRQPPVPQPAAPALLSPRLSSLVSLAPSQRQAQLLQLTRQGNTQDRHQSRYLLGVDALEQRDGRAALEFLANLEQDYPLLAAPILTKRAEAFQLTGQTAQATATWKMLLQQFPQQPEAAQALYGLGQTNPRFWDEAIARFPAHPQTIKIVQERLRQNPNQPALLLLLAKHALYLPDITQVLDRLTADYAKTLTPEDWAAIGFGYWEKQIYGKAGQAYSRATSTPLHAYRAGRGLQLGEQTAAAIAAYQRMLKAFPQSKETPLALLRLAALSTSPPQALSYLDRAITLADQLGNPERAAEALLAKLQQLEAAGQKPLAAKTRQKLLSTYSATDAAAELRWTLVQQQASQQNWAAARRLALELSDRNPNSPLAPEAVFWAGEWARQLGEKAAEQQAFQRLWQTYPQSYYTWRAASLSGWEVGNFTTVRSLQPQVNPQPQRLLLAAGSPTLQELYALGQDQEAWTRWQWEFRNRVEPTIAEQLSDGLLRMGVGDYLDGIFMLENLKSRARTEPENREQVTKIIQTPGYWYALYPLPYLSTVLQWSQQRQLNPLLVMALIRQESRFQTQVRSIAGAVGLMQVMPETGAWIADQLQLSQYVLDQVEDNVKLGTWYLDYTHETYKNNSLLALASYNAGPGNVEDWLNRFGFTNPDVFIERIPFSETQNYVKVVLENYWNYLRLYNPQTIAHLQQVKRPGLWGQP
uniref:Lytic transglycosylase catalytic n=1 Tax=Cyanothece sp. (strain PCC 7425 / ATCC 29141) TaxID=395961 RepID=B8HXI8_CYAP4